MINNIFISPSQQRWNKCILGDTEQNHMFTIGLYLQTILKKDPRFNSKIMDKLKTGTEKEILVKITETSNKFNSDLHISIHSDGGYTATGCTCFYVSSKGKLLSNYIYGEISNVTPWKDIGSKFRDNLWELNKTNAIACLVEVSFHDKQNEADFIHKSPKIFANAIYIAICKYYGYDAIVERTKLTNDNVLSILKELYNIESVQWRIAKYFEENTKIMYDFLLKNNDITIKIKNVLDMNSVEYEVAKALKKHNIITDVNTWYTKLIEKNLSKNDLEYLEARL